MSHLLFFWDLLQSADLRLNILDLPSGSNPSKEQKKYHEMSLRIHDNTYEVVDGRRKKSIAHSVIWKLPLQDLVKNIIKPKKCSF